MSHYKIENMTDSDLRAACKEAGIKCAPISDFTRKYYKKKLMELEKEPKKQRKTEIEQIEKENLSKDEIEKLSNADFNALLDKYKIKKVPLTGSSKKMLAKKIYLRINNLEEMEWETDLHEIDE